MKSMRLAAVIVVALVVCGTGAAFGAGSGSPTAGGPTLSQVEEAIVNPGISTEKPPRTDPQAAEELPHRDLTREQANNLLTSVFGPELQGPAGIFDELEVEKFYSDNVALIAAGDQLNGEGEGPVATRPTLLESSLPLRTEGSTGSEEAVDLGLEHSEGELQPANPLVEVGIPSQLDEGISLPESGVRVELVNAPSGRTPSTIDQSVASYPNVARDTTFAVGPTPTGMETMTLLQSADAPTSQTFHLDLPAGASLEETQDGGAEVTNNGEPIALVRPPTALDANEAPVPVRLETTGSSIVVTAEPGQESTFPILVDPMWESYTWYERTTTSFQGWDSFSNSSAFTTSHNGWQNEGKWNPGLQIASGPGPITPGAQARWDYHVPRWATDLNTNGEHIRPTSFITRVIFSKLFFDVQAYANNPLGNDPFFAFYIWDETKPGFVYIKHRYGLEGNLSDMNYQYNLYNYPSPNDDVNAKQTSLELVSSQTQGQYRQLYVGLAAVELGDKDFPAFSPLFGPSTWVNNSPTPITFTASDSGLGVREISLNSPLKSGGTKTVSIPYSPGCTGGTMSPCPREWKSQSGPTVSYDPSVMPQGEDSVKVDAVDPVGNKATQKSGAPSYVVQAKVDHTLPILAPLSGTLTEQAKVGTQASQYTLKYSATDGDHEAATPLSSFGTAGTGVGQLQRPFGLAVDGSGNFWVADQVNNRVEKFDENGNFLMQFGTTGSGNGQFKDPRNVAIAPNGTIWVIDAGNKRVEAFNSSGQFIRAITYASFVEPTGLAIGSGGVVWVADLGAHRIFEFSETGTFIRKAYGSASNPNAELSETDAPLGIATDALGNLWVVDCGLNRVIEFDANGKYVSQFGSGGGGIGQLHCPIGIAVAPSGHIFVADGVNNRVEEFQPSGDYLRQFGTLGSGSAQLNEPRGIAAVGGNKVLVADAGNHRIARWSHADLDPQSGVVSTEVKVDGQPVEPKYAPGCPTRDCSISREWTLNAGSFASGQHNVEVIATDGVGLSTQRTLAITTTKDTTGPNLNAPSEFFTAPEGWLEQKSYSYTSSASDGGGYGVTSLVLKIDGQVLKSASQTCPNGGCSASISGTINMSAYEGGAHSGELIATDAGGNTTKQTWTINVDPKGEVSASEAVATLEASDVTSESTVVASTDEVIEKDERQAGNNPGLLEEGEVLESTGTPDQSTIAIDPADGFTVETPNGEIHAEPVETGENSTQMIVAEEVAATSANSDGNVDTVIRPVFNGLFDYQSIRDSSAPEEYSWEVQLGSNQHLEHVSDQYVAVKYENEEVVYAIVVEPAHDAVGTTIQTSLGVSGNVITLTVPHRAKSYVYPVVSGVGWEGGFTTNTGEMPPPEHPGPPSEISLAQAEEIGTPSSTYSVVPPPEPCQGGGACASIVPARYFEVKARACSNWGCDVYWFELKNALYYRNFTGVSWEATESHPLRCESEVSAPWTLEVHITHEGCGFHPPYTALRYSGDRLYAYSHFEVDMYPLPEHGSVSGHFSIIDKIYPSGYQETIVNRLQPWIVEN